MMTYIHLVGIILFCLLTFGFQIFASAGDTASTIDFSNIFEKYGSIVGILGIFVYWTWVREQRMATQILGLESYVREKLVTIIQTTTGTLSSNIESTKIINATLEQFSSNLTKLSSESTQAMITTLGNFSDAITKLSNETRKLNAVVRKSPCLLITAVEKADLDKRRSEEFNRQHDES